DLDALAARLELEAVVHAADVVALAPAVRELGAAMATAVVERDDAAAISPVKEHRLLQDGAREQFAVDQLFVPGRDVPAVLQKGLSFRSHGPDDKSAFLRRYVFQRPREALVRREIDRPMFCLRARRILSQVIAVLAVLHRPHRARHEAAAAVRAHVRQPLDARRAEGALEAADPGVERVRRQVLVAMLAVRPQLERHQSAFTKSYLPTPWTRRKRHGPLPALETWCTVGGVTLADCPAAS